MPEKPQSPFSARFFTSWLMASIFAGIGIGIQHVTVPLYIRDRVDFETRALAISGALIAQSLPGAFLALFGGALADRVEKRRILVRTFGLAAAVSVVYVLLLLSGTAIVWPVYPLAALVGAAGAFTNPARQAQLPQIVGREQLQNAVILGTMGYMATFQFVGPAVGGLVTDAVSLTAAFALEVVLLLIAAALFWRIPTGTPEPSERRILEDLVAGLRYVKGHPQIRELLMIGGIPGFFFMGPFGVTVPLIVPDVLERSDRWVGFLWGAFGAGIFCGSILLTRIRVPYRGGAVICATISGGLMLTLYSRTTDVRLVLPVLFVWGLGAAVFINFVVALLQELAEERMMGRTMSMYSLVFFVSGPLGYAQAGLLTDRYGPQHTLLLNGLTAIVCGVLALTILRNARAVR